MNQDDEKLCDFERYLGSFRPKAAPPLRQASRRLAITCVALAAMLAVAALLVWQALPGAGNKPKNPKASLARQEHAPKEHVNPAPAGKTRFPTLLSLRMRAGDERDLIASLDAPSDDIVTNKGIPLATFWRLLTSGGDKR